MKNTYYCDECLEEIAAGDVFWENDRAYCGQCGSELDMVGEEPDLVEEFSSRRYIPVPGTDNDDEEEEEEENAQ